MHQQCPQGVHHLFWGEIKIKKYLQSDIFIILYGTGLHRMSCHAVVCPVLNR